MSVLLLGVSASGKAKIWQNLIAIFGEGRSCAIIFFLCILVVLLHVLLLSWLLRTEQQTTPTIPLMMEVETITIPATKPNLKQMQRSPQPKLEKKIQPKAQHVKPLPKKLPRLAPKILEETPAIDNASRSSETQTAPTTPPSTASDNIDAHTETETFTEANFSASYLNNPKPGFPSIARNRGWQGMVRLRVLVSTEGLSKRVEVLSSSGHDILDENALEIVKNEYRFVPAKRGQTPVESWVIIPINYRLSD